MLALRVISALLETAVETRSNWPRACAFGQAFAALVCARDEAMARLKGKKAKLKRNNGNPLNPPCEHSLFAAQVWAADAVKQSRKERK